MKTVSQNKIDLVSELAAVIEIRKHAEKQENGLKDALRSIMGDDLILEAGAYVVQIKEKSRSDLDRAALAADMGIDFLDKYKKETTYTTMELSPLKKSAQKEVLVGADMVAAAIQEIQKAERSAK